MSNLQNAFVELQARIDRRRSRIRYSPVQPTDRVLGEASEQIVRIAAFIQATKRDIELKSVEFKHEPDRQVRKELFAASLRLQGELKAAEAYYSLQLGYDFGEIVVTLRSKNNRVYAVVTETDDEKLDAALTMLNHDVEASVENDAGGNHACAAPSLWDVLGLGEPEPGTLGALLAEAMRETPAQFERV